MKRSSHFLLRAAMAAVTAVILTAPYAGAQTALQNVPLTAGWNAVWLEVEPVGTDGRPKAPETVFNHPAIQQVATPKPLAGLAEFYGTDPGTVGTFNQDEWQTWKRNPGAVPNSLPLINGNRPYLVQVASGTAVFGLPITGKARFFRPTWTPDRFNLVGFGLQGTPSFASFFGPSSGKHPVDKIFRLNGATGAWQRVTGAELMTSGQAYWIFSAGVSNYMGPVAVDFANAVTGTLNFAGPGDVVSVETGPASPPLHLDLEEIVFTNLNLSGASATPSLELTALDSGAGLLSLRVARPVPNSLGYALGNLVDSSLDPLPAPAPLGEAVAPGKSAILTLGAQRNWTTGLAGRTNLYRLTTGAGGAFWLPVSALKDDLQLAATQLPPGPPSVAGLWIGDVSVNAATSMVVDGGPIQPTAGSAPLRVLLHADSSGALKLLTQVTIMQTKSADPSISPVPVIVVDQAKIPFFEGVKERNGKRVGLRIEATSYDMPRKLDATSQSALLNDPAYPGLTASGLSDFLVSRSTRPPSLKEVYDLTWPMAGSLGSGQTVTTANPLVLDPFHRSNPLRHAFHQNLPKGPKISRTMTFAFAAEQPVPGVLQGTYREVVSGLTKSNLTVTGTIALRRISTVATLDSAP